MLFFPQMHLFFLVCLVTCQTNNSSCLHIIHFSALLFILHYSDFKDHLHFLWSQKLGKQWCELLLAPGAIFSIGSSHFVFHWSNKSSLFLYFVWNRSKRLLMFSHSILLEARVCKDKLIRRAKFNKQVSFQFDQMETAISFSTLAIKPSVIISTASSSRLPCAWCSALGQIYFIISWLMLFVHEL